MLDQSIADLGLVFSQISEQILRVFRNNKKFGKFFLMPILKLTLY